MWPVRATCWIGHAFKPERTGIARTKPVKTGDSAGLVNRTGRSETMKTAAVDLKNGENKEAVVRNSIQNIKEVISWDRNLMRGRWEEERDGGTPR
ncbi:hypothetical protein MTR_6g466030 [Medicago truncatula]|uniref:Uncharacterized protein n=1 Tax=Medicago truncatula TaxID=3880 RepID=A0A072U9X7_MEDTR|nr:hypothetical protein MTR_6g466030 [Medicago truncatula]